MGGGHLVKLAGRTLLLIALGGVVGLSACSVAGPAPVLLVAKQSDFHMAAALGGTVSLSDDGCYLLEGSLMVWPNGSSLDGDSVVLGDGRRIAPGDHVSGGGGFVPADSVEGILVESSRQHAGTCIRPGVGDFAVLQEVP